MADYLHTRWTDDMSGEDWIPMEWFEREDPKHGLVHDWYWKGKWRLAKCDIKCEGAVVTIDYSGYKTINENQKAEIGVARVRFHDPERRRPIVNELQWAVSPGDEFRTYPKSRVFVQDDVEFDIKKIERKNLPPTTSKQLVDARRGHGQYRSEVMAQWKRKCAVTGIANGAVLRASHIKPWRYCEDDERLDRFNGLILCANLDALFDRYLITFSPKGEMEICGVIDESDLKKLGLPQTLRHALTPRQKKFMEHHRQRALGDPT